MSEIVKSISIQTLLNQRSAVVALVEQGMKTLQEAADVARHGSLGFPDVDVVFHGQRCSTKRLCGSTVIDGAELLTAWIKAIDAGAWAHLMNESGLRTFMDAQARKEWGEKVYSHDVPPLTFENITATFTNLHGARGDMFERGVLGLFRSLSWNYKTNEPFKFGKRVIMESLFYVYGTSNSRWLSTNSNRTNELDDLERVFHILDGKPEPDHRNGWCARLSAAERNKQKTAEGAYFDMKWFLKGTGHIVFNRPDLVDKMNLILAKHHPNAIAHGGR